jgi:ATP-binding cassette subfamily B multidrug efflux pump
MIKFKTVDYLPNEHVDLPKKLLPFIWHFVRQMKFAFVMLFILFGLSSAAWALIPYYIGEIVNVMEQNSQNPVDAWVSLFPILIMFGIVCFAVQPFTVHIAIYIQSRVISVFTNIMRRQLAVYVFEHSYGFFQSEFSGRIAGKIIETPSAIRDVVHTCLHSFLWSFTTLIVSIGLLYIASEDLFVGAVIWLLLYAALITFFTMKIKKLSEKGSIERSHVRGRAVDILSNMIMVKFFSRKNHEDSYLLEKLRSTANTFEKSDIKVFQLWLILEILSTAFWGFIIYYTVTSWLSGSISTGNVAMILPATYQMTEISWRISTEFSGFFQRLGEVEEGMEAISKPHSMVDRRNAIDISMGRSTIDLDSVDFSYEGNDVFKEFNLSILDGQKIGLVGQSGAGKSTLVSLLLRLYDIQSGTIKIDGQNISEVTQESLRRNIAVIPQDTSLFHRSLMDNIRYGNLDASDDAVIEAAKKAHAHDFIMDLPDAYDTMVGERGVKLSGGQRQRIAIARAILKDAPILILDEATSALDSESERLIQDSLRTLMDGKTVIAIAHRLSTISHLDRLIVMDKGQIIEDGTHENLLNQNGQYAKLWSMQSGGFLGD